MDFFQWGKVYVLYTEQGLIIKRIMEGMNDEHVLVISENTEHYKEFQLHKSEIIDIAIVIGVIRLE
jgi:phage repressor protein C with HTH and peptisase S24 domain